MAFRTGPTQRAAHPTARHGRWDLVLVLVGLALLLPCTLAATRADEGDKKGSGEQ